MNTTFFIKSFSFSIILLLFCVCCYLYYFNFFSSSSDFSGIEENERPCRGHGYVTNSNSEYCICYRGYQGPFCEFEVLDDIDWLLSLEKDNTVLVSQVYDDEEQSTKHFAHYHMVRKNNGGRFTSSSYASYSSSSSVAGSHNKVTAPPPKMVRVCVCMCMCVILSLSIYLSRSKMIYTRPNIRYTRHMFALLQVMKFLSSKNTNIKYDNLRIYIFNFILLIVQHAAIHTHHHTQAAVLKKLTIYYSHEHLLNLSSSSSLSTFHSNQFHNHAVQLRRLPNPRDSQISLFSFSSSYISQDLKSSAIRVA